MDMGMPTLVELSLPTLQNSMNARFYLYARALYINALVTQHIVGLTLLNFLKTKAHSGRPSFIKIVSCGQQAFLDNTIIRADPELGHHVLTIKEIAAADEKNSTSG